MLDYTRVIANFIDALLSMNRIKAAKILQECYAEDNDYSVLERIIGDSLQTIGEDWETGSTSLAQIYMSGVICEELIDQYFPQAKNENSNFPKLAIAVLLDHHALGKKLVTSIIKAHGFDILDLGKGLSVDELLRLTLENNIEILLISTLMLPSALKVGVLTDKLRELGSEVKVIVGGAPFRFDHHLWEKVGADADGKNATDIIDILNRVVNSGNG